MLSISRFLGLAALGLSFVLPAQADAEWTPSKPVRIIVPYAAGGGADIIVRRLSERASTILGQPILVDNRPGAGTAIGASAVARSPADGYTLLLATSTTLSVNPVLKNDLPYSSADFTPVASLQLLPFMLNVGKNVEANTMKELQAYAGKHKGELNYGTLGAGSSNHVLGGLLNKAADIDTVSVHFTSAAPALLALARGDIQIYFDGISTSISRIKNGDQKGLAVTSQERVAAAPSIPTVHEAGFPDLGLTVWYGLVAPAKTPANAIRRLNAVFNEVLRLPEVVAIMEADGTKAIPATPEEFSAMIKDDGAKWRRAIETLNIKIE